MEPWKCGIESLSGCCGLGLRKSKMQLVEDFKRVNWSDESILWTITVVILCPLIWNIVARLEHNTRFLTKAACGNKYRACYALATWIFCFSAYRDHVFHDMMNRLGRNQSLDNTVVDVAGWILMGIGGVCVVSSMYKLGITGTYLGDYCGILMDARVTGFPYNVLDDPMYMGASMAFLGSALHNASAAGVGVSAVVWVVYLISGHFEGSFTAYIYSKRTNKKAA